MVNSYLRIAQYKLLGGTRLGPIEVSGETLLISRTVLLLHYKEHYVTSQDCIISPKIQLSTIRVLLAGNIANRFLSSFIKIPFIVSHLSTILYSFYLELANSPLADFTS